MWLGDNLNDVGDTRIWYRLESGLKLDVIESGRLMIASIRKKLICWEDFQNLPSCFPLNNSRPFKRIWRFWSQEIENLSAENRRKSASSNFPLEQGMTIFDFPISNEKSSREGDETGGSDEDEEYEEDEEGNESETSEQEEEDKDKVEFGEEEEIVESS